MPRKNLFFRQSDPISPFPCKNKTQFCTIVMDDDYSSKNNNLYKLADYVKECPVNLTDNAIYEVLKCLREHQIIYLHTFFHRYDDIKRSFIVDGVIATNLLFKTILKLPLKTENEREKKLCQQLISELNFSVNLLTNLDEH